MSPYSPLRVHTEVQLTIQLPNQPGALAKISDRLRAAEVNIEAVSCSEGQPATLLHLIVDDVETAKITLQEMGKVTSEDVLAFTMKNKPGAIASIARTCAGAGINIRNIYTTTSGNKEATVYVLVDAFEKAREVFGVR